jgi:hypothetical protein
MSKLLATAMLLTCNFAQASTGYFLIRDKKVGLKIDQELLSFMDYEAEFLVNKYNFLNTQSINLYLPNETKIGLALEFRSKLKEDEKATYNYFLSAETKLW